RFSKSLFPRMRDGLRCPSLHFKGSPQSARAFFVRAFIFPGQGSQSVGMGRTFAEAFACARKVFDEIDDALSQRLSRMMWDGPPADLELTENAQPAIMACSLA